MTTDDERIRYLEGDEPTELDPAEQAELDELRALLADPATWAEPIPELEDLVVAAVTAEAGATPGRVVPITAARRRRGAGSRFAGIAAAAAAVVVIGLVAVSVSNGGDDDAVAITLQPTELVPGASGTAQVTAVDSGLRIELDAPGLPRRDNGRFYQAWLRNEAGDLIPIGTFHEGDDVTLWAGVPLEDYPTLTITEEDADGDQASSGRRVLVGTVDTDG
jgi:hypothetical protein